MVELFILVTLSVIYSNIRAARGLLIDRAYIIKRNYNIIASAPVQDEL